MQREQSSVLRRIREWGQSLLLQQEKNRRDGANLIGYARGEFGIGESLRAYANCLAASGFTFSIRDIQTGIASRQADHSVKMYVSRKMDYWASIIFVNAALLPQLYQDLGAKAFRDHHNVGYWLWELEKFPDEWNGAFGLVDEVWTPTGFVRAAIQAATTKPVFKIPMPVAFPDPGKIALERFGVPSGCFVFLCNFDFNSYISRKNPKGAIDAFCQAFPLEKGDVRLLLKSINGDRHPESMEMLRDYARIDSRIIVHDGFISRSEMLALLNSADAYVSLHRSEGFGLGIAESMFLGKPVIATGYSGNMEFMNDRNSLPVRHVLQPVSPGDYPAWSRQRWAEPDVEHAAWMMVRLVEGSLGGEAMRSEARRTIRQKCSWATSAKAVTDRLKKSGAC